MAELDCSVIGAGVDGPHAVGHVGRALVLYCAESEKEAPERLGIAGDAAIGMVVLAGRDGVVSFGAASI